MKLPLWGLDPVPAGRMREVRIPPDVADRCAWINGRGTFDGSRLYRWSSTEEMVRAIRKAQENHSLMGGDPIPWAVDPAVRSRL